MNELELEITNAPDEHCPIDDYVGLLADAGTQNPWEPIPDGEPGAPGFRLDDKARRLVTTLTCEAQTSDYFQYRLEARNKDGTVEMRTTEWIPASGTCSLHMLYGVLTNHFTPAEVPTEDDVPDMMDLTDNFIDALLKGLQGKRPGIHFTRSGDNFVSDDFGISESIITLTKDWDNDISSQYSMRVEKPDGTLVLSCSETSKNNDDAAELRKLYGLLDKIVPLVTVDTGTQDVRRYIEAQAFNSFFDRVIENAVPKLSELDSEPPEGSVLIYDIFQNVSESSVIRQFLDEVSIRKGPLSEPQYKQLKALAQSVFTIIRNTNRCPNGRVFTTRAVAVAYDKPGLASRGVKWSSNLSRIANSYTMWGIELVGQDPAIGKGHTMNKLAVLTLAAILADHIQ